MPIIMYCFMGFVCGLMSPWSLCRYAVWIMGAGSILCASVLIMCRHTYVAQWVCIGLALGSAYTIGVLRQENVSTQANDSVPQEQLIRFVRLYVSSTPQIGAQKYGVTWLRYQGVVEYMIDQQNDIIQGPLTLQVTMPYYHTLVYRGNTIEIEAKIKYREYVRNQNIQKRLYVQRICGIRVCAANLLTVFDQYKQKMVDYTTIYMKSPYNYLLQATILGMQGNIDQTSLWQLFRDTGTMHLIAISGLNFMMVMWMVMGILRGMLLTRKIRVFFGIIACTWYALLLGTGASVMRAALMMQCYLCAQLFNREYDMIRAFACTGIVLLLWRPDYVFDIGFQFSFLCIASLIWIVPVVETVLYRLVNKKVNKSSWWYRMIISGVCVSLGVSIGIAPLSSYYFHAWYPAGIVVNLFAVPICFVLNALGIAWYVSIQWAVVLFPFIGRTYELIAEVLRIFLSCAAAVGYSTYFFSRAWVLVGYYSTLAIVLWIYHAKIAWHYSVIIILGYMNIVMGVVIAENVAAPAMRMQCLLQNKVTRVYVLMIRQHIPSIIVCGNDISSAEKICVGKGIRRIDTIYLYGRLSNSPACARMLVHIKEQCRIGHVVFLGNNKMPSSAQDKILRYLHSKKIEFCFLSEYDTLSFLNRTISISFCVRRKIPCIHIVSEGKHYWI